MLRITVVGAGVIGLTCAVRLLEAGHRVDVVARELPLETTSATAAAIWYPYRALPQGRVTDWAATSYDVFAALSQDTRTGVRMVLGTEVFTDPQTDPWWRSAVANLERVSELPAGFRDGWSFRTPVVEMPVYLVWLAGRVQELGGTITRLHLGALPSGADVVVDCAGLGARRLASDPSVGPVRGQVLVLEQCGLEHWWLHSDGPTYVVPRTRDIVVGGTADEGEWERTPSPATAAAILARAERLVPQLHGARVLHHRVGLRPVRPEVRLERSGDVVHCYGHGGAGVTLSWGCAEEVVLTVV
ncbi:FAD-dependent oxidoreductase [Nocardioides sp.]|uniref:FAD-dependent oxidoreductase n=1 Tax=Nocardioides sp. TaxID=35761 RepID=UPI00356A026D